MATKKPSTNARNEKKGDPQKGKMQTGKKPKPGEKRKGGWG